jgi:hypothetical protein
LTLASRSAPVSMKVSFMQPLHYAGTWEMGASITAQMRC